MGKHPTLIEGMIMGSVGFGAQSAGFALVAPMM